MHKKIKTDLPLLMIIGLALLTLPRVIVHDLRLTDFDSIPYTVLAVVPFMIWIAVAVLRKTSRPFHDFLAIGFVYGLLQALTHQLLWNELWNGRLPHFGGNLGGVFDPALEQLLLQIAAFLTAIGGGLLTGLLFGLIAYYQAKYREQLKKKKSQ